MSSEKDPPWYDPEDSDEPVGSLRLGLVWLANFIFLPAKLFAMVERSVMSAIRDVKSVRRSMDTERLEGCANGRLSG